MENSSFIDYSSPETYQGIQWLIFLFFLFDRMSFRFTGQQKFSPLWRMESQRMVKVAFHVAQHSVGGFAFSFVVEVGTDVI